MLPLCLVNKVEYINFFHNSFAGQISGKHERKLKLLNSLLHPKGIVKYGFRLQKLRLLLTYYKTDCSLYRYNVVQRRVWTNLLQIITAK